MLADAKFSDCRKYRYVLTRIWNRNKPVVAFIGLNPSFADEFTNDPTLTRCIHFAATWGYGGLYMLNLFAWIATKPEDLKTVPRSEVIDIRNDDYIRYYTISSDIIVAAWGVNGGYLGRDKEVITNVLPKLYITNGLIRPLMCLGKTKQGYPKHPLYLKKTSKLIPF